MTSDERREVAATLREFADTDVWLSAMFAELENFGDTNRPRADAIADLIDPTCEMTDASWDNGECTWGCICSACGAHIEHEQGRFLDYCPNCGARVVSDDG